LHELNDDITSTNTGAVINVNGAVIISFSRPDDAPTIPDDGSSRPNDDPTIPDDGSSRPNDDSTIPDDGSSHPNDDSIIPDDGSSRVCF
jgi:hypothetical protein